MRPPARLILLILIVSLMPSLAYAALVNINTADLATLETLPHIGATIGGRIIDYRTQHGPFTSIAQLQNISGIGSGSNYADIAPLVTVGDVSTSSISATGGSTGTTTTTTASGSSGSASTYVPPPSAITIDIADVRAVVLDVPVTFSVVVKTKGGSIDPSAEVSWSFGDGSSATGHIVEKTYRHTGTYLVVVRAVDGTATAQADITVTAKAALVRILDSSSEGLIIVNDSDERLDISDWRLSSGPTTFRFPEGTTLLPRSNVLFPWSITNLPLALEATLSYPDGIVAARYPEPVPASAQLETAPKGSHEVQTVESVLSNTSHPTHVPQALDAPREIAAPPISRGAATMTPVIAASVPAAALGVSHLSGILHSNWTLSLLGILALAGGAFMIL